MKAKSLLLLFLVTVILSCSGSSVRDRLMDMVEDDLNFAVSTITDEKALADSIYFDLIKYSRVGGTLISYVAIVDYHYLEPYNFPVFQRIVYRYNETTRDWERHRRHMLRLSLKDDDLDKYITGF